MKHTANLPGDERVLGEIEVTQVTGTRHTRTGFQIQYRDRTLFEKITGNIVFKVLGGLILWAAFCFAFAVGWASVFS